MHSWMTKDRLHELIVNLSVLGDLEEGYKLNTKERYLVLDNTTWYQSLARWYRGDSRKTTISKVNRTIEDTCQVVKDSLELYHLDHDTLIMDLSCETFLRTILEIMEEALKGLKHLCTTYNNDITIGAQLEINIRAFEGKIIDIRKLLYASTPKTIRRLKRSPKRPNQQQTASAPPKSLADVSLSSYSSSSSEVINSNDDSSSDAEPSPKNN